MNEQLLFRFPLRPECAPPLLVEARLLATLAEHLPLPVPNPEYVTHGCDSFSLPFFAYGKLAGVPMAEANVSDEARDGIGRQLGRFLTELHRFPTERAAELGVPTYSVQSWRQHYVEFSEKVRARVLTLLPEDATRTAESFWRGFLGDDRYFRFQPVLIHRDLDGAHVLVDQARGRITGVIDFGDALVGDPALDFAGFEGSFRDAMLQSYELPVDETFERRPDIYRRIGPFHGVIYGLDTEQPDWVRRGLEAIRAGLKA